MPMASEIASTSVTTEVTSRALIVSEPLTSTAPPEIRTDVFDEAVFFVTAPPPETVTPKSVDAASDAIRATDDSVAFSFAVMEKLPLLA